MTVPEGCGFPTKPQRVCECPDRGPVKLLICLRTICLVIVSKAPLHVCTRAWANLTRIGMSIARPLKTRGWSLNADSYFVACSAHAKTRIPADQLSKVANSARVAVVASQPD